MDACGSVSVGSVASAVTLCTRQGWRKYGALVDNFVHSYYCMVSFSEYLLKSLLVKLHHFHMRIIAACHPRFETLHGPVLLCDHQDTGASKAFRLMGAVSPIFIQHDVDVMSPRFKNIKAQDLLRATREKTIELVALDTSARHPWLRPISRRLGLMLDISAQKLFDDDDTIQHFERL